MRQRVPLSVPTIVLVLGLLLGLGLVLGSCASSPRPPPALAASTTTSTDPGTGPAIAAPAPAPATDPPGGAVDRSFADLVDPGAVMAPAELAHLVALAHSVCHQAVEAGTGQRLAERWRAAADRAASDDLAGLDFVLMVGLAEPAARTSCPQHRGVIEEALAELDGPGSADRAELS